MVSPKRGIALLAGILILALVLRVWGLTWGLPSATHYFSYHPDESVVLEAATGMNVFTGHLLPGFYNYGSLQLYLVCFANSLAFVFGEVDIVIKNLATDHAQWARMYLIGRILSVLMGVGTVWATYALGRRLWGQRAGMASALLLAIMPLHAQHSHWLTVDVPAAFWGTLALLWAAKSIAPSSDVQETSTSLPAPLWGERPRAGRVVVTPKALLWAGVFAGLATATKYNMALLLLPLLIVCVLARSAKMASWATLAAVLAFLMACPGAVLDTRKFVADVRYEAVHVGSQPGPTFADTGNGLAYLITHTLNAGMGLPLLLLTLGALGYAAVRRTRGDSLLAAFAVPYAIVISVAAVRYARYTIPLLPLLALWGGRLLAEGSRLRAPSVKRMGAVLAAVVLLLTLADSIQIVRAFARPDPRDRALEWMQRSAIVPATVGFGTAPWFGTPPLNPYFSLPQPGGWRKIGPLDTPALANARGDTWRLAPVSRDWDTDMLTRTRPAVVLLTEYGYSDALRVHDPQAEAFLALLRRDYVPAAAFTGPPPLFRLRTTRGGLPVQDLPHDMLYPEPNILIYERRR